MSASEGHFEKIDRLMQHPHGWAQKAFFELEGDLISLGRFHDRLARSLDAYGKICALTAAQITQSGNKAESLSSANQLREEAYSAQVIVHHDFISLNTLFVVCLWGYLENACINFVAEWMTHDLDGLKERCKPESQKCLPSENADFEECLEKASSIERKASRGKAGIERLEALMQVVGISKDPAVDEATRSNLLELHQLRDVYAHRRGLASESFCMKFKSQQVAVGSLLFVNSEQMNAYFDSARTYAEHLRKRVWHTLELDKIPPPVIEP